MTFVNEIRGHEANVLGNVPGRFRSLSEAFEKRRLFKQTVNELRALSLRDLNDLGYQPHDINRIAYEAVYGK